VLIKVVGPTVKKSNGEILRVKLKIMLFCAQKYKR
jgi:hypothetical protein